MIITCSRASVTIDALRQDVTRWGFLCYRCWVTIYWWLGSLQLLKLQPVTIRTRTLLSVVSRLVDALLDSVWWAVLVTVLLPLPCTCPPSPHSHVTIVTPSLVSVNGGCFGVGRNSVGVLVLSCVGFLCTGGLSTLLQAFPLRPVARVTSRCVLGNN